MSDGPGYNYLARPLLWFSWIGVVYSHSGGKDGKK